MNTELFVLQKMPDTAKEVSLGSMELSSASAAIFFCPLQLVHELPYACDKQRCMYLLSSAVTVHYCSLMQEAQDMVVKPKPDEEALATISTQ